MGPNKTPPKIPPKNLIYKVTKEFKRLIKCKTSVNCNLKIIKITTCFHQAMNFSPFKK
jgi:hypothetical protein